MRMRKALCIEISPSNIFAIPIDGDPDFVKVLDFGVAKMLGDQPAEMRADITQIGRIIGTPRYMPQANHISRCGCAGRCLHGGNRALQRCAVLFPSRIPRLAAFSCCISKAPHTLSTHRSPYLDEIPARLEAAVMKALEKQPVDRFRSMDEFLTAEDGYARN